jgi:hypothetical protein
MSELKEVLKKIIKNIKVFNDYWEKQELDYTEGHDLYQRTKKIISAINDIPDIDETTNRINLLNIGRGLYYIESIDSKQIKDSLVIPESPLKKRKANPFSGDLITLRETQENTVELWKELEILTRKLREEFKSLFREIWFIVSKHHK